jgi:hypothetical protein
VVDLANIAARLDADEKFRVKYQFPVRSADGQVTHEVREGSLMDVAEHTGTIWVSCEGQPIWVKNDEILEIIPDAN